MINSLIPNQNRCNTMPNKYNTTPNRCNTTPNLYDTTTTQSTPSPLPSLTPSDLTYFYYLLLPSLFLFMSFINFINLKTYSINKSIIKIIINQLQSKFTLFCHLITNPTASIAPLSNRNTLICYQESAYFPTSETPSSNSIPSSLNSPSHFPP